MAVVDPGEEVIVFEPFYENYGPDTILCGATPRFITLHEPDWHFDEKELARAFNNKTKAIIINTPNNPTGKVFSREELQFIADLCLKWGVLAVTDEIYEHILYDGARHVSHGLSARHARADHHHQFHLQDVQPDRLAGGLGGGLAETDRFRAQGPRLPDGRGGPPAPGGGRRRPAGGSILLPNLGGGVPGAEGLSACRFWKRWDSGSIGPGGPTIS